MKNPSEESEMTTQKVYKACIDYMMTNNIHPDYWKSTDASLVCYTNGMRTVVALDKVLREVQ